MHTVTSFSLLQIYFIIFLIFFCFLNQSKCSLNKCESKLVLTELFILFKMIIFLLCFKKKHVVSFCICLQVTNNMRFVWMAQQGKLPSVYAESPIANL